MKKAVVIADKYSASTKVSKGQKLYAKAGERVTIISDFGGVFIVEKENKERFPILKTEIRIL